jgi:hypothetical protein
MEWVVLEVLRGVGDGATFPAVAAVFIYFRVKLKHIEDDVKRLEDRIDNIHNHK